jgi:hypothetical protein
VKDLVPVFAAVAGGLLTALGSFMLQRTSRTAERRTFLRERLEQMYTLTSQLQRWGDQQVTIGASVGLAASPESGLAEAASEVVRGASENRSSDEIVMLARFYHPRLTVEAEQLDGDASGLLVEIDKFLDYIGSKPFNAEVDPKRLEAASEARDNLGVTAERFKQSLSREARAFT